jgi:hypothetical protein
VSLLVTRGLGVDTITGTSTYMGMPIPIVEETIGPDYAADVNACLAPIIDAHNHAFGKGAPLTILGLETGGSFVDGNFPFNGFNLESIGVALFDEESGNQHATRGLYFDGVELWVGDGNGNNFALTNSGQPAAGGNAANGFQGDYNYPTLPAAAFYTSATGTYDFWQNSVASLYAIVNTGRIVIHQDTVESVPGISLISPALSGAYSLTLPNALPTSGDFGLLQVSSSGAVTLPSLATPVGNYSLLGFSTTDAQTLLTINATLAFSGTVLEVGVIQTANIAADAVTQPKLGDAPLSTSTGAGASGNLTTQASYTALPNSPSVTLTPTAQRPVLLHQNLVGFANTGGSPSGADTISIYYDLFFNGTTHFYLPVLWPTIGGYFNQNDNVPSATPTFTQAGDAADYQTAVLTAGSWVISLVYKANTSSDGTTWSTTAVTLKAVLT